MERPRVLLVPTLTELEWLIRPQLEEWADVASFDVPGVGDEPRADPFDREAIVRRTVAALEQLGWDACFMAADSHGITSAVLAARAWDGEVQGLALGHARLSNRTDGARPPLSPGIWDVMRQLLRSDYDAFIRYGLTQMTQGSVDEEQAKRLVERVPYDVAEAAFDYVLLEKLDVTDDLRALDVPLLFVKHEGCLSATEEGWEDAVAAFPDAKTATVARAPNVSDEFADALRSFCLEATPRTA